MPIIGFEGPDGVGKTTSAEALAAAVGGATINQLMAKYPGESLYWKLERRAANAQTDPYVRLKHFLDFNRWQKYIAQQYAMEGAIVVLDTTVYRTVATHSLLGAIAQPYEYELLKPDAAILLTLGSTALDDRLIARDGELAFGSQWDGRLYEQRPQLWPAYRVFGLPEIDAARPTPEIIGSARELLQI